jgi:hypothetical protein
MTIWPLLTGKSSVDLAVAGATAVTVMSACLRAVDTAGLTTTSVLSPMTVALDEEYGVVADVPECVPLPGAVPLVAVLPPLECVPLVGAVVPLLEVLLLLECVTLVGAVVPLLEVLLLLGLLSQAATTSTAATIAATGNTRE